MVFGFLKWGEESATALDNPLVETGKKVIEQNRRQQDKLIASLLDDNTTLVSRGETEIDSDKRNSFLMKLVAGEIGQDKIDQAISVLRLPIETLGASKLFSELSSSVGGVDNLRSLIFNASRGLVKLSSIATPYGLDELAIALPLPRQAQEALGGVPDKQASGDGGKNEKMLESFLRGFYGERFEYHRQAEFLKAEAEEKFGNQEKE